MRNTFAVWKTRRQTRRELESLSERELADIGINRGDISRIAAAI